MFSQVSVSPRGGGVSRPRWEVGGSGRGVSPGPQPGRGVRWGVWQGTSDLQVHIPGGVSRPRSGVSQHALRQPPQQTATAADGTRPTGMHSCLSNVFRNASICDR